MQDYDALFLEMKKQLKQTNDDYFKNEQQSGIREREYASLLDRSRYDRMRARAKALEEEIKTKENEILAKNTTIATQAYDLKERQKEIANLREQNDVMSRKLGTNLNHRYLTNSS